jgi:hypothetical protein
MPASSISRSGLRNSSLATWLNSCSTSSPILPGSIWCCSVGIVIAARVTLTAISSVGRSIRLPSMPRRQT